ncbi:MAG: gamma-glutamyltransferase family protein [Rhodospirillales bacterium]|nr:gamma-glutamyltransferase family protein [Rhodospirillales bacterium]
MSPHRPADRRPRHRAMIVAPQPDAVEAGIQALAQGGSAIDATIACALMQGVVDPMMCGVAGLGVLHVHDARTGRTEVIDGLSTVPAAATATMWEGIFEGECTDGYGYVVRGAVNELGHGAVTTPGILRVFEAAHASYGRLPWAELFAPAIERARDGWAVRPHVAQMFASDDRPYGRARMADKLAHTAEGRALYMEDGRPKAVGRMVRNPNLAATLERLARHGAEDLYSGELAQAIVADMRQHGGLLDAADLATFKVRRAEPLTIGYRGRTIAAPAPAAGGIVVLEMLRILERFDLVGMGHNSPDYIRTVAEAMKIAGRDRERHVGDPETAPAPVGWLLSDGYAQENAAAIARGEKASLERATADSKDTTTISCWDENGLVVSLTHTLGLPSGAIVPGTGFMLNGAMNWYDPRPGRPNSIGPGSRRFSSMAPTLVFEDGKPAVTLGAPGGAWIGVAVLQGLLNLLDWGMGIQDAVMAPRFSATTNTIDISNRIPRRTEAALNALGYAVNRSAHSYPFAALHGITGWDGVLEGGADPQRDGCAAGL